jgi:hypothetical protein
LLASQDKLWVNKTYPVSSLWSYVDVICWSLAKIQHFTIYSVPWTFTREYFRCHIDSCNNKSKRWQKEGNICADMINLKFCVTDQHIFTHFLVKSKGGSHTHVNTFKVFFYLGFILKYRLMVKYEYISGFLGHVFLQHVNAIFALKPVILRLLRI